MAKEKAEKAGKKEHLSKHWQAVPLKGSFMVISIIGFFVSAYIIYDLSPNFGRAFMIVFALMFVASLISMTKAPITKREY